MRGLGCAFNMLLFCFLVACICLCFVLLARVYRLEPCRCQGMVADMRPCLAIFLLLRVDLV